MGYSQRIRTEIGINKTINVELEQDFNFLEILSLKIQQEDVYDRSCANYGVVVGRITANNGYGIPNAKVSIFVPIDDVDKLNPEITAIYPYTTTDIKNEDGYRYNLLPYEQSYSNHVPTGTFPSRKDALTNKLAIEIYDKYYKYTVKTNDSGDYMIMGVPLGVQIVFLDLDLSDIGEFSLTPQDLIRMGRATDAQVSGPQFKSSNNLNSLPQIVNITKSIDVSPLWGDENICRIAINRVDFDLRDDANIDIQPTAVFMGSLISSIETKPLKIACKPSTEMGNLCNLVAGPGEILAIRQTIYDDSYGRPVLEQYNFNGGNNVIDTDGSWLVDVPMNLEYVVINEFGERVFSNDPKVGIPTKSKYRFKVKWKQSNDLSATIKRGYFLVPNIREGGWISSVNDPRLLGTTNPTQYGEFIQSYAFSLDWADYGNTGTTKGRQIIQSAIDCEDRFYQFSYNKVYTVSGMIDLYHKGTNRGRFIGIKQITDNSCDSTNYKFPTNDGTRNFDMLFNIVNFLMSIILLIVLPLLPVIHIVAFIWPLFKLLFIFVYGPIAYTIYFLCKLVDLIPGIKANCKKPPNLKDLFNKIGNPFKKLKFPILTYPECEICSCTSETVDIEQGDAFNFATRAQQNQSISCTINTQSSTGFSNIYSEDYCKDDPFLGGVNTPACSGLTNTCGDSALAIQELMAGNGNNTYYKRTPASIIGNCNGLPYQWHSQDLTLAERLNLFNTKAKFFNSQPGGGWNQIKVSVNPTQNAGKFHYDNVMALLIDDGCADTFTTGAIISFNGSKFSTDPNLTGGTLTTYLNSDGDEVTTTAVKGLPKNVSNITINCADPSNPNSFLPPVNYILNQSSEIQQALIPNTKGQINNITFTYDGTSGVNGTYTNVSGTTDGVGVNATFNIVVLGGVPTSVTINNVGYNYEESETITILGSVIGGQDGYDDVDITVTNVSLQQYENVVFQKFPTDVEYFQVITAMTYGNFSNLNPTPQTGQYNTPTITQYDSLRYRFTDNFMTMFAEIKDPQGIYTNYRYGTDYNTFRPIYTMPDQKQYVVAFLVRGVDPHSSRQPMNIDISKLMGKSSYGSVVISGNYKLNIPIQPGLVLPRHNDIRVNTSISPTTGQGHPIFFDSYFYQVPSNFSSYTTNLIANYSALDATALTSFPGTPNRPFQVDTTSSFTILDNTKVNTIGGYLTVNATNNLFAQSFYQTGSLGLIQTTSQYTFSSNVYSLNMNPNHYLNLNGDKQHRGYYPNEYIEGGTYFYAQKEIQRVYNNIPVTRIQAGNFVYFSPIYPTGVTTNFIAGTQKVVMRTDRLPSSTYRSDTQGNNTFVLHQNLGFSIYAYDDNGVSAPQYSEQTIGYNSGDNIEDEPSQFEETIINSFSCQGLAPLSCYSGNGENFGVKPAGHPCFEKPSIVRNGCYVFVDKPIIRLVRDFQQLAEWKARFKVNLAACRGVFGHNFVNNWVNGTLFAFPIKNKRLFGTDPTTGSFNVPFNKYCKDVVMLHPVTNNFFYRSSPYNYSSGKFVGFTPNNKTHRNKLQLQFPTTIMDLGPRDAFANELSCSSDYFGYNINNMKQTSYQDVSNILNLFIISRQISSTFLGQLLSAGDASVDTFFSRKKARFDGDYAQAISVNSEIGVDEFDFESYDYTTGSTGGNTFYVKDKTVGIFFSSDTQIRDYISPKRIIRNDSTVPGLYDYLSVFTQVVPMYKWNITQTNTTSIFGNQYNDWATTKADIQAQKYQSLDRVAVSSNYFRGQVNIPSQLKGYIYNVVPATPPLTGFVFEGDRVGGQTLANGSNVTVGAPFYFYFGLVRGNNALDKFNVKYLGVETI